MKLAAALTAALGVAFLGATTPAAVAKPLRVIARAEVALDRDLPLAVRSDASRWYAYQEHRGVVVAVDTRAHARLAIEEPGRCSLQDLRFARILLSCRHDPRARVVSLPSGTATDFADPDPSDGDPLYDELFALGRYWLGGFTCEGGGRCAQVYLNRSTMERRVVSPDDSGDPNVLVADVDTPNLALKDTTNLVDLRSGGYRLTQRDDPADPLILTHDGRHRTLSACRPACSLATLGGGLVTWYDGKVRAYALRRRKAYSWSVPLRSPDDFVAELVHTSTTILVKTRDPSVDPSHERLYASGIPRRR